MSSNYMKGVHEKDSIEAHDFPHFHWHCCYLFQNYYCSKTTANQEKRSTADLHDHYSALYYLGFQAKNWKWDQ